MDNFAPELRLLLALLRSALGNAGIPALPAGTIDWTRFLALVERHRVGAFLHVRAAGSIAQLAPAPVASRLKAIADATVQRALAQGAEQIRLMRALDDAGVEVMAVKGLVLAQDLYHGLGRRHVGDIDLLVRVGDVERADAVLQQTGLHRTRPDFALTPRQTKAYLRLKPEFEYRKSLPMRIELLWRLEGLREDATESAWNEAVAAQIGGHSTRTLAPELNALYLLQHGARHAWFRLFWLVDVALLLRAPALDWTSVAARARELRIERSIFQGVFLAEKLLGATRPAGLTPHAGEHQRILRLADEAQRQIVREPELHEPVGEWFRQATYRVHLQQTVRAKLAMVTPHLFSPLNWQTWPLPDRWFFLYYFATPFLWLYRRVRRTR